MSLRPFCVRGEAEKPRGELVNRAALGWLRKPLKRGKWTAGPLAPAKHGNHAGDL